MNSFIARFAVASFAALVAIPAFAANMKPVHVSPVAKTASGRTIVKADGSYYIEMQGSEMSTRTAQEMYETYRSKFKAMMDEDMSNETDYIFWRDGSFAESKSVLGFSIIDGHKTNGIKFTPTREYRLNTNPGAQTDEMSDGSEKQGAVLTAGCRNPQGRPDVVGYNAGRSGCYGMIKLFRRLNLK